MDDAIKHIIDLSFYNGKDTYSDGDVEDELLAAARENRTDEMLHADNRWAVLCHLSEVRSNLLSWLPITRFDSVLEIGCGCGALTGTLCQKAGYVDAIEISPRRAEITAWRNRERDNLKIHVGNLNDVRLNKKFDYVTLVGVLEYAGTFTHTSDPHRDFIDACRRFLKPDGKLIVAIENRIGMKYWSGAAEDHTGLMFDGILDYPIKRGIRTFSKRELSDLLNSCGLRNQKWYYPFPDYKFPFDIYSDRRLPTAYDMFDYENLVFDRPRKEIFSENQAFAGIISAGLFAEFANSFLVLSGGKEAVMPSATFVHHARNRRERYRIRTELHELDGRPVVHKVAQNPQSIPHLKTLEENCRILTSIYGARHVAQARRIQDDRLEIEYVHGKSLDQLLCEAVRTNDRETFFRHLSFCLNGFCRGTNEEVDAFSIKSSNRRYDLEPLTDKIILRGNDFVLIDYEWLAEKVSKKFVAYRMLSDFFERHKNFFAQYGVNINPFDFFREADIKDVDAYRARYEAFIESICDRYIEKYRITRRA